MRKVEKENRSLAHSVFSLITVILIAASFLAELSGVENYEYFGQFQSLIGFTGNIVNPAPDILERRTFSLGINKFNVGVTYGLLKNIECGIHFNLKELTPFMAFNAENIDRKLDEISFHSKLKILDSGRYDYNFSVGHRRSVIYCTADKYFPEFYDITVGAGIRIRYRDPPGEKIKPFFSLLQTQAGHRFIFDFNSVDSSSNFGWRFLLSPEVALDLFVTDILRYRTFFDNFYFGANIVWK